MLDPSVRATAVNRHGWVVGDAGEATLVAGDRPVRLPGHREGAMPGGVILYTISDDGTTAAGQAALTGGASYPVAVIWRCR